MAFLSIFVASNNLLVDGKQMFAYFIGFFYAYTLRYS